ncbi:MAG: helix-turn-helix domain-containing protein [Oscillibacter sp.]|jgi:excisionase family DNA binding protein|uniref:helix-turn-helix domain-containing protein n=1 Tax=Oscillibacter sp. TaxID=1945593 RepID=UPI00216FE477|nr:helix-turn-helix domain-containing protein [Oscillibacter sp.]MCI9113917.1 helix-turn-helix domain-containing protein [Oscillibacter sp.]
MREMPQDTLTVKELQQILKIGANSAYTLIHSKAFPVIKIGQTYRIPAEAFYAWLKNPGAADN